MTIYYKFRDARLAQTKAGKNLTTLYYKHGAEVSQILAAQDGLHIEARRLLSSLAPDAFLASFRNKELRITRAEYDRAVAFMNHLKMTASPELKADLEELLDRLSDGSLQKEIGYVVW